MWRVVKLVMTREDIVEPFCIVAFNEFSFPALGLGLSYWQQHDKPAPKTDDFLNRRRCRLEKKSDHVGSRQIFWRAASKTDHLT